MNLPLARVGHAVMQAFQAIDGRSAAASGGAPDRKISDSELRRDVFRAPAGPLRDATVAIWELAKIDTEGRRAPTMDQLADTVGSLMMAETLAHLGNSDEARRAYEAVHAAAAANGGRPIRVDTMLDHGAAGPGAALAESFVLAWGLSGPSVAAEAIDESVAYFYSPDGKSAAEVKAEFARTGRNIDGVGLRAGRPMVTTHVRALAPSEAEVLFRTRYKAAPLASHALGLPRGSLAAIVEDAEKAGYVDVELIAATLLPESEQPGGGRPGTATAEFDRALHTNLILVGHDPAAGEAKILGILNS